VAIRKYIEASGRHYNGSVAAIIAARAAASAYSASHGADARTTHSLIGYREKDLSSGWVIAVRLAETNKIILDYLLLPTSSLVGRMIRFTDKARNRHNAHRFDSIFTLARSLIRRITTVTVLLHPSNDDRNNRAHKGSPKPGAAANSADRR
jgi:hypothetical protein